MTDGDHESTPIPRIGRINHRGGMTWGPVQADQNAARTRVAARAVREARRERFYAAIAGVVLVAAAAAVVAILAALAVAAWRWAL